MVCPILTFTRTGMGVAIGEDEEGRDDFHFTQVFIGRGTGKSEEEPVFFYTTPIAVISD